MVLFSQEPYTTQLITKVIPNVPFSYRMIWEKNDFANALLVNRAPAGFYEDVLVFSKSECYEDKHPLRNIMLKYIKKHGKDFVINLFLREGRYTTEASARVHASYKFGLDRKSTRLNSSHVSISYAVFCLKKKNIIIYH